MMLSAGSSARDHCANERTFLSWLRLSLTLTLVGLAFVLKFDLNAIDEPSHEERTLALPLGYTFIALAILSVGVGLANYLRLLSLLVRKAAIVQPNKWITGVAFGIGTVIASVSIFLMATHFETGT
ncbi:hypothetical protein G7K_3568-t1 [Saitoella complicata NRRL Y-17804]|uniref:DUF202 domain-containing protein n=1 Tax=Saitoella complicata (strain BCRC 22490 / CBS 7301 / JCM 7358 / NBRC 10748 / NRRL Y-17804) TaxID=698492 RepID=A0A0E9NHY8_SAICN|nr:hypothetical protein G7K_3568-t1 [Saitoella complicata NRRL Y-17804]